jgi:arginine kinase
VLLQIKYLANLVTEQELSANGISVTGPLPARVPLVSYPEFDPNCTSLLKKNLTREIWQHLKKKSTTRGGNIQICVKSGVHCQNEGHGVMASDEDAYKTFSDLFGPVILDLHPKFDFRYSYRYEDLNTEAL